MPSNFRVRVPPNVIAADYDTLVTLQSLTDYCSINPAYSIPALQQLAAALSEADEAQIRARRAHQQAREQAAALSVLFHNAIQAAKAQVVAQYGIDSPALHAIGRKQKSERRRPARRAVITEPEGS